MKGNGTFPASAENLVMLLTEHRGRNEQATGMYWVRKKAKQFPNKSHAQQQEHDTPLR